MNKEEDTRKRNLPRDRESVDIRLTTSIIFSIPLSVVLAVDNRDSGSFAAANVTDKDAIFPRGYLRQYHSSFAREGSWRNVCIFIDVISTRRPAYINSCVRLYVSLGEQAANIAARDRKSHRRDSIIFGGEPERNVTWRFR